MRIAITGSSGLIGSALRAHFEARGDAVTRIVRSGSPGGGGNLVHWDIEAGTIDAAGLEGHDLVIHLAGESIAGVWTPGKKRAIKASRVRGTTLLAGALARLERKPAALFSASGSHYYGDRGDEPLTEQSPPGTGFLADVVKAWEAATAAAEDAGIRVVHMRNGMVLSPEGGVLAVLRRLFRLGLGGEVGDGSQYWPWIALDDVAPALVHVLERTDLHGPVNFVSPTPTTNAEFTRALAKAVHRPAFLDVPAFAARLLPGGFGEEMLLGSARVGAVRLTEGGYVYRREGIGMGVV
jgi:uncharacterized protein (TIGR01777 family)